MWVSPRAHFLRPRVFYRSKYTRTVTLGLRAVRTLAVTHPKALSILLALENVHVIECARGIPWYSNLAFVDCADIFSRGATSYFCLSSSCLFPSVDTGGIKQLSSSIGFLAVNSCYAQSTCSEDPGGFAIGEFIATIPQQVLTKQATYNSQHVCLGR